MDSWFDVVTINDYNKSLSTDVKTGHTSKIELPSSNVLEYRLENGCSLIVRPSGTEPKIKYYFFVKGNDEADAKQIMDKLSKAVLDITGDLLK